MITLLRNDQRRFTRHGEQNIWRSFFAPDHPCHLGDGFGPLVALDEMRLPPGARALPHADEEAEGITYIYQGALSREDNVGNYGVAHAGEFLRMATGHRFGHTETSLSRSGWVHLFRVAWRSSEDALDRSHEQRRFTTAQRRNHFCVVASPDGRNGSLRCTEDVLVKSAILDPGQHLVYELKPDRGAWLQLVYGEVTLNDSVLKLGDGVGITDAYAISLTVQENTELLLVDLSVPSKARSAEESGVNNNY